MPFGIAPSQRRTLLILLVSLVSIVGLLSISGISAQSASFSATIDGGQQVPPNDSAATGSFSASTNGTYVDYTLTIDNAMSVTQAHIHVGAAGENGPVAAFLFGPDEDVESVNASGRINESNLLGPVAGDMSAFLAALSSGNAYVNVHTAALPPGEVRGQISATASGLPNTGSGGLAGTDGAGGTSALLWALVASVGFVALMSAGRLWMKRER